MKVSVITPSFNQGQFIERTLRSVSDQEVPALEHVVFDGGSSDETTTILASFGHGIRWVSEPDRGQSDAVNKGIRATDGDIVGWLNSDDVYYPGALARVVDFFEANPDVDVVYGMADHIGVDDVAFEAYPTESWNSVRLRDTCFICQPALFFRRQVVTAHGLLDESLQYCMDYEYWLRLVRGGARFAYLPEKLAGSRLYPQNKTMSNPVAVHKEINGMLRRYGPVPDAWLFNYAYVVVRSKIDEQKRPIRFAREVTMRSLLASLRWNGHISSTLVRRLFPRLSRFS
ncbi:glycosyltransferase family 2 protein [Rhodanobacter thiooxydans]|uniref:glycosyltransferase family 2 protein n=1 Tax=Rhodanobacter thiooxydans TaxID=416169 RepID=UPI0009EF1CFA|nr:glycosyltransferase family 2 protein [Rhodanobacter thiooxydans]